MQGARRNMQLVRGQRCVVRRQLPVPEMSRGAEGVAGDGCEELVRVVLEGVAQVDGDDA